MNDNTPATRAHLNALEERLVERIGNLETHLLEYIDERTHDAETRLLRAFSGYNNSANIRFRKLEADSSNIDVSTTQRLGELERQMTEFKMRLIALESQRPT
ncbi:MAG TPA: hypothetical protein VFB14_17380 [Bryobacteraceae bacterium]|jgi:uncharacterized protein YceH (UPF0502 family)|nr:hypothetical protein [Bryobacteraceae bacterium]